MDLEKSLKLLSDTNRIRIIQSLRNGEICVCDMADSLNIEQSLLSHHLKKLKEAGFVKERRLGRWIHYSLDKKAFEGLETLFLENFSSSLIKEKRCNIHNECCQSGNC